MVYDNTYSDILCISIAQTVFCIRFFETIYLFIKQHKKCILSNLTLKSQPVRFETRSDSLSSGAVLRGCGQQCIFESIAATLATGTLFLGARYGERERQR